MSPFFFSNVFAMRSTSAGGGSSETKRCASFNEMKCAVCGLVASMCSTSLPSSSPLGLMSMSENKFRAGLVHARIVLEAHAVGRVCRWSIR